LVLGELDDGPLVPRVVRPVVRVLDLDDPRLRPDVLGGDAVTTMFWLAGILSVGLFVYLLIALFKPEKLQ
jgi:K+-transporting ATPase KdpF subunit